VPGILDEEYNRAGTNPTNLCENCAAGGMDKCQRNTRELYYGDSGAFRCLVESKSVWCGAGSDGSPNLGFERGPSVFCNH